MILEKSRDPERSFKEEILKMQKIPGILMDPCKRSLEKVKRQLIHQGLQIAQHLNESCKICRESLKNPEDPIRIPQESFKNYEKS